MNNWPLFFARYYQSILYNGLGPNLFALNNSAVWEDMQRFKQFGEFQ